MNRLKAIDIGVLPILVATMLRFYDLGRGHPGLSIYSAISRNTTTSFHNWFYPSLFPDGSILADKPPVFFWVQGFFIQIMGTGNLALRMPAAIAAVCSVALLFLVVRRTHGKWPAFIAAFFLAVIPLDVNFSRGVFLEPVTTSVILLCVYLVVTGVQDVKENRFYWAAGVLGLAFMIKLWQGLLPAPGLAVIFVIHYWGSWLKMARVSLISSIFFSVVAFAWPISVWLTSGAYDSVMHSENVWDMIFGWNLFQRFGALEYGASHSNGYLWFLTGPMGHIFAISLVPVALVGAVKGLQDTFKGHSFSLIWIVWVTLAVAGFGGASVKLSSYWASVTPAVAALTGIGAYWLLAQREDSSGIVRGISYLLLFGGLLYVSKVSFDLSPVADYFKYTALAILLMTLILPFVVYFKPSRDSVGTGFNKGEKVMTSILAVSLVMVLAVNAEVTMFNLMNPRSDTLGRIGFDRIQSPMNSPQVNSSRARLRGTVITAVVRAEVEELNSALAYVEKNRKGAKYLLAGDSFNTTARVAFVTGDPVLTLYSEYQDTTVTSLDRLDELVEKGELRFILASSNFKTMNFRQWGWIARNGRDVTASSGLDMFGEMRLFALFSVAGQPYLRFNPDQ